MEVTGNKYFFGAKAKFFSIESNVNSKSRLNFGNPLTCQSLEICFNKQCHHFKICVIGSYISPLLISIKKCEQNIEMARRRNQIPSTSETNLWLNGLHFHFNHAYLLARNLYFANIMLIACCVQPPAIFLHSGGKFPSCSLYVFTLYHYSGFKIGCLNLKGCFIQNFRAPSQRYRGKVHEKSCCS